MGCTMKKHLLWTHVSKSFGTNWFEGFHTHKMDINGSCGCICKIMQRGETRLAWVNSMSSQDITSRLYLTLVLDDNLAWAESWVKFARTSMVSNDVEICWNLWTSTAAQRRHILFTCVPTMFLCFFNRERTMNHWNWRHLFCQTKQAIIKEPSRSGYNSRIFPGCSFAKVDKTWVQEKQSLSWILSRDIPRRICRQSAVIMPMSAMVCMTFRAIPAAMVLTCERPINPWCEHIPVNNSSPENDRKCHSCINYKVYGWYVGTKEGAPISPCEVNPPITETSNTQ